MTLNKDENVSCALAGLSSLNEYTGTTAVWMLVDDVSLVYDHIRPRGARDSRDDNVESLEW